MATSRATGFLPRRIDDERTPARLGAAARLGLCDRRRGGEHQQEPGYQQGKQRSGGPGAEVLADIMAYVPWPGFGPFE